MPWLYPKDHQVEEDGEDEAEVAARDKNRSEVI